MYLPFMPRWKVVQFEYIGNPIGWCGVYRNMDCGNNYRRKHAEQRASQLAEMTGRKHRVIDRKHARR